MRLDLTSKHLHMHPLQLRAQSPGMTLLTENTSGPGMHRIQEWPSVWTANVLSTQWPDRCIKKCVLQLSCLKDFQRATIDDICTIHDRNYVLGLEKIVGRGKNDVVDSAPTYITPTSFDDALRVRTKGLSLCRQERY